MHFRRNGRLVSGKETLYLYSPANCHRYQRRGWASRGLFPSLLTGTPKSGASERLLCGPNRRIIALDPQIWEDERLPSRKKGDPARIRLVLQDHALYCSQSLQMPKERQTQPPSESPSLGGRLSSVLSSLWLPSPQ